MGQIVSFEQLSGIFGGGGFLYSLRGIWDPKPILPKKNIAILKTVRFDTPSETKGPGEEGALPKRAKMVLSSFHRSHREIRTRNRPLSD